MKYYVEYNDGWNGGKLVSFSSKKKRDEFVLDFSLKHQCNPDCWISFMFTGEIEFYHGTDEVKDASS